MSKAIYIATSEPESGKSIVTLGLMRTLLGKTNKVAYFRPIIENTPDKKIDNHINTVLTHFDLDLTYEDCYAVTGADVINKKANNQEDELIDTIISKYKNLEDRFDFILVEGTDFSGEGLFIELDFNVLIAKNLGIPTIIVSNGKNKTIDEIIGNAHLSYDSFDDKEVTVLALVANKIDQDSREEIDQRLKQVIPASTQVYTIPFIPSLDHPTMKELVEVLDAKVLFGESHLNNQSGSFAVGAMQLRNFLRNIFDNCLVITPGDRADLILGALQANISRNYPKISGIVLTGGILPEEPILKLIEGLSQIVPIISVQSGTFETTNKIGSIRSHIYAENKDKIYTSLESFEKHVNVEEIAEKFSTFNTEGITPRMFQYNLVVRAKKNKKHIVLPEGSDERILRAAIRLVSMQIVEITLLGNQEEIVAQADNLGLLLDLEKIKIIDPVHSDKFDDYVDTLYELRKGKVANRDMAKDLMSDVSYFGTMMVYKGHADGMVSGAVHTTQHTIRPALQFIKTKPGKNIVSSVFFMCLEDRVSVFGDCAINPNPTAEELAEIALSSAESSKAFGIEPKVAMLSYSSGNSGKGEGVNKVREATEIVKRKKPDLKIEGPIQYDAAVDMQVGQAKMPNSEVAGQASVLIFPDLNTGNNTYKAVQRETGALAIGPMLQGLNKPVNDLSRGCTVDDVFNTVIITAIQAQGF
ncbi:phosphate acetyltransferase [Namhaeicola litoreus]|uniref:Phosphate acetyltransferase n=1 Tax=Namhaeicola litoreus TaxID=1052145 RepID=A0ABW3Y4M1_9FLAO